MTLRARRYLGQGREKQALDALRAATEIDPGSREAAQSLAAAYSANQQGRAAIEESLRLLKLGPRTRADHDRLLARICDEQQRNPGTAADALCAGGKPR